MWLLTAVALGSLAPVSGDLAAAVDWATYALIFALFFLHGARLPREALVAGLTDWRLQAAILGTTFLLFPLIGIGLASALPGLLSAPLWTGILFLCALPSTVQSAIAFTSMAGGNVAGAIAAAAFSQILGVVLTPMLVSLLLSAQGSGVDLGGVGRIAVMLLLPFLLGHLARPWLANMIAGAPRLVFAVDKGTILAAVYGAFSAARVDGIWSRVTPAEIAFVVAICVLLLGAALAFAATLGRFFRSTDRPAILFCGSVKSIVSGVPMARILFPGAAAGIVILPIMLYHAIQLIACAWIAVRMGRQKLPAADNT